MSQLNKIKDFCLLRCLECLESNKCQGKAIMSCYVIDTKKRYCFLRDWGK
jgi:hypothetical protein